jgi:hypothetical protein
MYLAWLRSAHLTNDAVQSQLAGYNEHEEACKLSMEGLQEALGGMAVMLARSNCLLLWLVCCETCLQGLALFICVVVA